MFLKKTIILFIILSIAISLYSFFLFPPKIDFYGYDLTKVKWQFREKGKNKWFPAHIPGSVRLDLMRNKIIADPFYGINEKLQNDLNEKDWEYKTEFIIPYKFLKKDNLELFFEGLDTYANVYFNDKLVLKADNFFREWEVNIKDKIRRGKNKIKIVFTSPQNVIKKLKQNYFNGKTTADYIFIRKPAYHFGWDWAPKIITAGIWKPVYIKAWDNVQLKNIRIIQRQVLKSKAILDFEFEIFSDKKQKAKIEFLSKNTNKKFKKKIFLRKGINFKMIRFEIKKPKLWWTHNLGTPHLYNFAVKIKQGRRVRAIREISIGIRTIKLIRKKDKLGESFYFELNGNPIFIKGANYIPQDVFLSRVKPKKYESFIKDVVKSNINMLRVWGGGFYEKDIFYKLCNKYGILVWQDFMFACAMYPADKHFLNNIKEELIYNIKKIRNHPSIALWCGNNEIYEGWNYWGWQDIYSDNEKETIWSDYKKIFLELIPSLIKKYDSERDYIHSSPLTNWGGKLNTKGDVHYWGIWHGKEPFENFLRKDKIGRFVSEFGFQGFPSFKTIKSFTKEKERRINSETMKLHEKHSIGYKLINRYMKDYYKIPKDFKDYIYVSELLQAYGIGLGLEAYRRAMPECMGSLYWQLNDCWPAVSWSGKDYYGRWKALQYKVKKLYSDIIISPVVKDNILKLYIISDKLQKTEVKLNIKLFNLKGQILRSLSKDIEILPNKSKIYYQDKVNNIIGYFDKNEIGLKCELFNSRGDKITEKYYYFVRPKFLVLEKPVIKTKIIKDSKGYKIFIKTDKFAKNIYLEFSDYEGFFTDNFFDLLPDETKTLKFITTSEIPNPENSLRIMTLYDTYED